MLSQKSRFRWLQEADSNSKFFHSCLLTKRRRDEIQCLEFVGFLVDRVEELKSNIKAYFQSHFASSDRWCRLRLDSLTVEQISDLNHEGLIAVFSEEEIWVAVWDCEGQKSPSPDGINFTFIKDF